MRYFTTTEAAAVLHIDPSRVRLLCKLGRIETIKVGNTYGIAESELERFAALDRPPGRPRHGHRPAVCCRTARRTRRRSYASLRCLD